MRVCNLRMEKITGATRIVASPCSVVQLGSDALKWFNAGRPREDQEDQRGQAAGLCLRRRSALRH